MKTTSKVMRLGSATMLVALVAVLLLPGIAFAASGIFESFVIINNNGGDNTYYDLASATSNPNFQGTNLGTFGCGQTLVIAGGEIQTFENSDSVVSDADIYYRITKQGDTPGSFANIDLDNPTGKTGNNRKWDKINNTTDVLANLGPGTYDFAVYGTATHDSGTHTLSTYTATFTVLARTKATGNWTDGSTWVGGAVPATDANVEICSGSTVTLNTDPTVRSIKINSGGTLQDDSTANTLTVAGTSTVNPSFTNNGTFTAGSGTVAFAGQNNINGRVWGSTATTFNNVTISYNGSGTGGTDVFGADFFDQSTSSRATINGTLTINTRGFVAHAEVGSTGTTGTNRDNGTPTYGASSTLKYNDLEYPEGEPSGCPGTNATVPFQTYGEWQNQTTSPGVPQNVIIGSDSWVSFNCNQGTSYRANGDFTVQAGVDGNTYGGSGTPGFEQNGFNLGTIGSSTLTLGAGKDVTNNGTLKQTGTPSSGTMSFLNIKDTGSANLYYGLDITSGSALGSTTVKVSGNQTTCPYWGTTQAIVKRCYYIAPTTAGTPQVTFYYENAELNGLTAANLFVWKDNGDGTWTKISPDSRSACTSGIACAVTVNSLSLAGGANRYVLSPASPLAVDLAAFTAATTPAGVTLSWETVSETDNAGFNVYRAAGEAGPWARLNAALIPAAAPGSSSGHAYTWTDATAATNTAYVYRLEAVALDGTAKILDTLGVTYRPAQRRWLPFAR